MFKDTFNDNVTLYTLLNDRRSNKEGLFPIHYRITYKRERQYFKSGKYCSYSDWELVIDESKKGSKRATIIDLRNEIQLGHETIKENIKTVIANNNGVFSFDKLNNLTKKNITDTLNSAFQAKIYNTKTDGKMGTSVYYNCALQSFKKFMGDNIKFSDITVDWLKKYEKFMIKKDATYTTVGMYCRAIRSIMNEALKNGIITVKDYPFGKGKYEIPTGESRKMALTIQQVGLLMKEPANETEKKYRDLWYFSYLCNGINIADLCNLKQTDIKDDVIRWYRQKTINTSKKKVKIEAIVLPQMYDIIQRWSVKDKKSDYIFPFLTGKESPEETRKIIQKITSAINKYVKQIALRIGITEISTYTARHSFATVLKRSGANIALISESLGHTDLKTTNDYLASFEIDEKKRNAIKLIPE